MRQRVLYLSLLPLCLFSLEKIDKYFIAIKKNEGHFLDALNVYTPLLPPKGKYYADPMLFKYQGINYLFFEDYDYRKGVIDYVVLDEDCRFLKPVKVLELPIHLSFPYVFQEGDFVYMTPETYDYKSVSLYLALEFPHKWQHERTLIEGEHFADPILFKHNGYYWLFTAVHKDCLHIYYANDILGPFYPHPINKQMIKGRNAGAPFTLNDRLIRPTMDCQGSYGKAVIFKEIILLDPDNFIETEIATLEATWAPRLRGTHAYSQNEDYVVYDGKRVIFPLEDRSYSSK